MGGRKRKQVKRDLAPSTSKKATSRSGTVAHDDIRETEGNRSSDGPSMERHPLYNSVILTNLFKFCSPKLQASCRLVCKTWRDVGLPALRSKATLTLPFSYSEEDEKIFLCPYYSHLDDEVEKASQTTLDKCLRFWQADWKKTPYQNLCLDFWTFGPFVYSSPMTSSEIVELKPKNRLEVDQFVELVGEGVRNLQLFGCRFADKKEFGRILYQSFPNLQKLTIRFPGLMDRNRDEVVGIDAAVEPVFGEHHSLKTLTISGLHDFIRGGPVEYTELLSHFPSLTSIERIYVNPRKLYKTTWNKMRVHPDIQRLLEAIQLIREQDCSKLQLDHFKMDPLLEVSNEIGNVESYELFKLFRTLNIPLSVRFRIDCDLNVVKGMIRLHRNLLWKIEALKHDDDKEEIFGSGFPSAFPFGLELTNLKDLTISDRFSRNMDFLKYTPNLERLRVFEAIYIYKDLLPLPETEMIANTGKTGMGRVKMLKLKEFSFRYRITNDDLIHLVAWFPNVERLSMLLDDDQFALVCGSWEKLEHLHVLGDELTDVGMTGMGWRGSKSRASRPNITSLKYLKCFKMQYGKCRLTRRSVLHGLLKTHSLKFLDITSYSKFGEKANKLLREKMDFEIVELGGRIRRMAPGLNPFPFVPFHGVMNPLRAPTEFWNTDLSPKGCGFAD